MNEYTKIIARNLKIPETLVCQILEDYVKCCLLQMLFSSTADTPFGVMSMRGTQLFVDIPSDIVREMLNMDVTDEDIRTLLADKVESGAV